MANKSWEQRRKNWVAMGQKVSPNFKMKKNGVNQNIAYMNVPAHSITLPADAHVIQRKKLYVKGVKGENTYDTYVLAAGTKRNYVSKRTGKPVTVQNWYAGKMKYYAGKPGVIEFLYNGTSERDARHRFADIPYNELYVAVTDNVNKLGDAQSFKTDGTGQKWAVFTGNGRYSMIVSKRIHRRSFRAAGRSAFRQ